MVHSVYSFKDTLLHNITLFLGYSKARPFKFIQYENKVAFYYKESSLQDHWKGLPESDCGILLFTEAPTQNIKTPILLSEDVLNNFLKSNGIVSKLTLRERIFLNALKAGKLICFMSSYLSNGTQIAKCYVLHGILHSATLLICFPVGQHNGDLDSFSNYDKGLL